MAAGHDFTHLDSGRPLRGSGIEPLTANAYLGGWGITEALASGADIVITPRVTDASLVTGPAAWWHGWSPADFDQLAGALAAGHVIECGPQATGGNYSFPQEVTASGRPGYPLAEVAADGSSVITKHPGTGGVVSVGTVTAQLLYEIGGPAYAGPDVIAHFDTIALDAEGPDRVRIRGARGSAPSGSLKVAINYAGGYRNTMTLVLTGLDIESKAASAEAQLFDALGGKERFDEVDVRLLRFDRPDAPTNAQATAHLQVTVKDRDPGPVGRQFSGAAVGLHPRRVRRVPHHDPASRRQRVRHLLACPGPCRRRDPERHPPRRHDPRGPCCFPPGGDPPVDPPARGDDPLSPPSQGNEHKPLAPGPPAYRAGAPLTAPRSALGLSPTGLGMHPLSAPGHRVAPIPCRPPPLAARRRDCAGAARAGLRGAVGGQGRERQRRAVGPVPIRSTPGCAPTFRPSASGNSFPRQGLSQSRDMSCRTCGRSTSSSSACSATASRRPRVPIPRRRGSGSTCGPGTSSCRRPW